MLLVLCWFFYGCSATPSPDREAGSERLVVMAPAAAEMIDRLGMADRIVGVGNFVAWPQAMTALPKVGLSSNPNMEQILALEADIYITARGVAAAPKGRRLEGLGVEVLALETGTYEGVFESLRILGERLGRLERARDLEGVMRGRLAAVAEKTRPLPPKSVLFLVGRKPLYVAGPGSHIDQLITLAGGENVAFDSHSSYQMISMEIIISRQPDIIIDSSDNRPGAPRGRHLGGWASFETMPAVVLKRVYYIDPQQLSIPGPRLPEMAELMAKFIHPEVFGEPTPAEVGPLPIGADDGNGSIP